MRLAVLLSLALLGVSTQSVQGKGLKTIKGKVSEAAARWLPQVGRQMVAMSLGASLLFAPLTTVEAHPHSDAANRAAQRFERRMEMFGPFSLSAKRAAHRISGRYYDAAEEARQRTNLQLKDEIEELGVGIVVNTRGELVQSRTSPYADLLSGPEGKEHLQLLMMWNILEIVSESAIFKRGAGITHRIERLVNLIDAIEITDNNELRDHLVNAWQGLVRNEYILATYLLKDEFVSAFPQALGETTVESRNIAAQNIKRALAEHHLLLNQLLQEKITIETYPYFLSTRVDDVIASAVKESVKKSKGKQFPFPPWLWLAGPGFVFLLTR